MQSTSGKTVLITGASSGIGLGLTQRFAAHGWQVAALARRTTPIEALRANHPNLAPLILAIECDVTDRKSVHQAVTTCTSTFSSIDVAIANAGVSLASPATEMDAEIFEKTLAVNVMGAVYLFEALIPQMKVAKSGQLVGISSLAAYRGLPQAGAYCASKAALSALMESMRIDLAPVGIGVTCIHPGFIKTPLTDKNRYWMPFLMPLERGVDHIFKAIMRKKTNHAFPIPLSTVTKSLRFWPDHVYRILIASRRNEKVETQ